MNEKISEMPKEIVHPGKPSWIGEHWINYLKIPGRKTHSGMISLYWTRYSPLGESIVAFVDIPQYPDLAGVYAENRKFAEYIYASKVSGTGIIFERENHLRLAKFKRSGDLQNSPSWNIRIDGFEIQATWKTIQAPIFVQGNAPVFQEKADYLSVFYLLPKRKFVSIIAQ